MAVAEALPLLIAGDDPGFMTRVALLTRPAKPKRAAKPAAPGSENEGTEGG